MSDKKETFGGEIAKNLPVKEIYNDVAHPALSTLGQTLQGATRVALAPISALIWGYDKIAAYLDVAIPEYFARKNIKEENIKSPDPSIAVPVIEAMRYTSHKEELREMFTNILGNSMNSETYDEHPAFVEIIKQLCSDECKMLRFICEDFSFPMIKIGIEKENNMSIDVYPYFSDICFKCGCEYPIKFPEYLDNLKRLGLVDVDESHFMSNDAVYQVLRDNLYYSIRTSVLKSRGNTIKENKGIFEISEFGKVFCSVCMDIPMEKIKQPKKK